MRSRDRNHYQSEQPQRRHGTGSRLPVGLSEDVVAAATGLINTELRAGRRGADMTGEWRRQWEELNSNELMSRDLISLRAAAAAWRTLWTEPEASAARQLNSLLLKYRAVVQLRPGLEGYVLDAAPLEPTSEVEKLVVATTWALARIIEAKQLTRLRICQADRCCDVYVDLSKNQSRRFCGVRCTNRTNAGASRARKRTSV